MTPTRYVNFMAAEDRFTKLHKGRLENMAYTVRLVARVVNQYLRYPDKQFAKISLGHLRHRLSPTTSPLAAER
jgi:hypothetical protein